MSNPVTIDEIEEMNQDQLWAFCRGRICETGSCYRECEHGNRFCIQCNYGMSQRSDEIYVLAKKRLQKLVARSFKGQQ